MISNDIRKTIESFNLIDDKNKMKFKNKRLLAITMMIKNEESSILVSLKSTKDYADYYVILDTGSTDKTINLVKNFCEKNSKPLFLFEEEFINFSASRNRLLDLADSVAKNFDKETYLLLMDSADELRDGNKLINYINTTESKESGFHFKYELKYNNTQSNVIYQARLIKANCNWRYNTKHRVHEFIESPDKKFPNKMFEGYLFQDRQKYSASSVLRWKNRDKPLLLKDYEDDKTNSRTVFYLARTCKWLGQKHEAYRYYKERTLLGNFDEEVFESLYQCAELAKELKLGDDVYKDWLIKAVEQSPYRIDAYIKLSQYYGCKNNYNLSYMYAKQATELNIPNLVLESNDSDYDCERWIQLGACAWYVQKYEEGLSACIKASKNYKNMADNRISQNESNIKLYKDKIKENIKLL